MPTLLHLALLVLRGDSQSLLYGGKYLFRVIEAENLDSFQLGQLQTLKVIEASINEPLDTRLIHARVSEELLNVTKVFCLHLI